MNTPFFSIIIPTYNRVNVLPRAIDSVLRQSFQEFELIIVDNGSTDTTRQWLIDSYNDDRIVYYYQDGSGSPAKPRNTGIILAKGNWLCFLDSDDSWNSEKLQHVFNEIQVENNLDVVCHNENIYFDERRTAGKIMKYGPSSKQMYQDMLVFGNRLSTSAVSVNAEFLRKHKLLFNESTNFSMVEDYDLWLHLARFKASFKFLGASLGYYSVGDINMSSNSCLLCENLKNLLKEHVFNVQEFSKDKEKLWRLVRLRFILCKLKYVETSFFRKCIGLFKLWLFNPVNFSRIIFIRLTTKK